MKEPLFRFYITTLASRHAASDRVTKRFGSNRLSSETFATLKYEEEIMGTANASSNTSPAKTKADNFHSIVMDVAFVEQVDTRNFRIGLALALWTTLLLIWLPGMRMPEMRIIEGDDFDKPTKRKVLKPPPVQPLDTVITAKRQARKTPMPDKTPDEPEPVVEPEEPEEPELVFNDDDNWEIGIPDGPPERQEVARVGEIGVEPPVFTKRAMPDYPKAAARIKLQGYVILEAILRKDGNIDDIKVLRGLGKGKFGFEEAAVDALKKWEFLPGKVNNKTADVRMTLKVNFVLKKSEMGS